MLTIVIDTPQRISEAFAIVDQCTAQSELVTSEIVPAAIARPAIVAAAPGDQASLARDHF